jgi:uncharacterized membrane protein HdeD (DUF308 family)
MIRFIAVLFGIAFIFAGVAGFMPAFTTNDALFGMFEVNTMHNVVHIVSGVIAIMAATSYKYTKWYFVIFGVVYVAVAIVGFINGGDLYIMHANTPDNFLHLGIGVVSLLLGCYASKHS